MMNYRFLGLGLLLSLLWVNAGAIYVLLFEFKDSASIYAVLAFTLLLVASIILCLLEFYTINKIKHRVIPQVFERASNVIYFGWLLLNVLILPIAYFMFVGFENSGFFQHIALWIPSVSIFILVVMYVFARKTPG